MNKEAFLQIIKNKAPFPVVYVDGFEQKIDHIHGENIVMTDGSQHNYRHVSRRFYTAELPVRTYEAIRLELLEKYHLGKVKLDKMQVDLSEKYGISQSAVKRINEQLTISDLKEYQENRKS